MRNTEIAFNSFKQFRYLSLHIGSNGDLVEVFRLFSMYHVTFAIEFQPLTNVQKNSIIL